MKDISGKRVLVVGDVSMDRVVMGSLVYGTGPRISRKPTFVEAGGERWEPGLSARVGLGLVSRGAEVKLCSVTSDDQDGFDLYDTLDDAGLIQVEKYLCKLSSVPKTLVRNKYVASDGVQFVSHPQFRVEFDRRSFDHEVIKEGRAWADVLVVQDYGYGVVSNELLMELRHCAYIRDKVIYINSWEDFELEEL